MLRINLLPSYIGQRRLTKKLIPLFAGIFLLSVGLPLFGYVTMQAHLKQLTEDADTAETGKKHTDDLKAQAASTLAKVKPIQDNLDFVTAVHKYTQTWVTLYNTLADKSPKSSFIYNGVSVNGPVMTINAYTPSVEEVGRYLQAMYQEPDFTSVTVDKLPAYPDNIRHLYYLGKVLVFADGASNSSSGGGSGGGYPGGGGGGSRGGGYPGAAGGSSGGSGYPGGGGGGSRGGGGTAANTGPPGFNPDTLGPNAPGNVPPGVGPPPAELTGGAPTGGGNGYPGGGGGGQAGGYSVAFLTEALRGVSPFATPEAQARMIQNALRRVRVVTVPKGFDITVTATLKNPLSPPTLPGSAPAGGAFGGGGAGSYPGGGGSPGGAGSYPGGGSPGGAGRYPGGGHS